ncbi:MAG TPA: hypothetical protein PK765_05025 [bacterium]|nr:hypothetical protein [bacterium]
MHAFLEGIEIILQDNGCGDRIIGFSRASRFAQYGLRFGGRESLVPKDDPYLGNPSAQTSGKAPDRVGRFALRSVQSDGEPDYYLVDRVFRDYAGDALDRFRLAEYYRSEGNTLA